jgi:hypothetical protein
VKILQSIVFLTMFFLLLSFDSLRRAIDALIIVALTVIAMFLRDVGYALGATVQGIAVRRVVIFGGGCFCEHRASSYKKDKPIVAMGPIASLALGPSPPLRAIGYLAG